MKRGFEIVSKYQGEDLTLPVRATQNAAGYDFCAAKDFVLPSIWKRNFLQILHALRKQKEHTAKELVAANKVRSEERRVGKECRL